MSKRHHASNDLLANGRLALPREEWCIVLAWHYPGTDQKRCVGLLLDDVGTHPNGEDVVEAGKAERCQVHLYEVTTLINCGPGGPVAAERLLFVFCKSLHKRLLRQKVMSDVTDQA